MQSKQCHYKVLLQYIYIYIYNINIFQQEIYLYLFHIYKDSFKIRKHYLYEVLIVKTFPDRKIRFN